MPLLRTVSLGHWFDAVIAYSVTWTLVRCRIVYSVTWPLVRCHYCVQCHLDTGSMPLLCTVSLGHWFNAVLCTVSLGHWFDAVLRSVTWPLVRCRIVQCHLATGSMPLLRSVTWPLVRCHGLTSLDVAARTLEWRLRLS